MQYFLIFEIKVKSLIFDLSLELKKIKYEKGKRKNKIVRK